MAILSSVIILCVLTVGIPHAQEVAPPDTIPPVYRWVSPAEGSVQTTDTIRLCVDANDHGGSGIDSVVFTVSWTDVMRRSLPRRILGRVDGYPYEMIWDCSTVPDISLGGIRLGCEVSDRAGNVTTTAANSEDGAGPRFVLDRNPRPSETMLRSIRTDRKPLIDGILDDWSPADSIVFRNNDNRVTAFSAWDREQLYLGIRVEDTSIIAGHRPGDLDTEGMSVRDVVDIYIDAMHDRSSIRDANDISWIVSAAGMMFRRTVVGGGRTEGSARAFDVDGAVTVSGTLNDPSDRDRHYIIEMAVPWGRLDRRPITGLTMGFEVWNNDRDFEKGEYFYAGWNTDAFVLQNPSEWGSLVLVDGGRAWPGAAAALIAVITITATVVAALLSMRRRRADPAGSGTRPSERECIAHARSYIQDHLADRDLSREMAAAHVSLTPSYFGKLFKRETGMSFTDYLVTARINRVRTLLVESGLTVAEIADRTGFASQPYLSNVFRKHEGISPTAYRAKHRRA